MAKTVKGRFCSTCAVVSNEWRAPGPSRFSRSKIRRICLASMSWFARRRAGFASEARTEFYAWSSSRASGNRLRFMIGCLPIWSSIQDSCRKKSIS